MLASIIHDRSIAYPSSVDGFSPSEKYPEYLFDRIAGTPNHVYSAVRECLRQAGLDASNYGTPRWNPLGAFIPRGSNVFLLCNFVYHRRPNESRDDFLGKCTHGSVVRAIADYAFIAAGHDATIKVGNAPLQSCSWERVLADTEMNETLRFFSEQGMKLEARDLRLYVAERGILGESEHIDNRGEADGVRVALDKESALNALYTSGDHIAVRVSDYNPDRTESFHAHNKHVYVINRHILESDVVVSIPKLKTHEKVGITVGLKGMVGVVGHKDCLAHHRFGPPRMHGDEYPRGGAVRVSLSRFHDFVHRRSYPAWLRVPLEIADENARRVVRRIFKRVQAGAWYGNDTAWRMTIDLCRIAYYADRLGAMKLKPQRKHLLFIDAVVAGEGEGPLSPAAVHIGAIAFADHLVWGDIIASRMMGYDPARIPLVREGMRDARLNGVRSAEGDHCFFNGAEIKATAVPAMAGRAFAPPSGWRGALP